MRASTALLLAGSARRSALGRLAGRAGRRRGLGFVGFLAGGDAGVARRIGGAIAVDVAWPGAIVIDRRRLGRRRQHLDPGEAPLPLLAADVDQIMAGEARAKETGVSGRVRPGCCASGSWIARRPLRRNRRSPSAHSAWPLRWNRPVMFAGAPDEARCQ
jgi:hypothetical protein